ncbi:MAG: hypothetical protein K6B46_02855 [Opitutales bacterium]|nr:hypothetical protein [Opitutales bacterium]
MKYFLILLAFFSSISLYAHRLQDFDEFVQRGLEKNIFSKQEEEKLMNFGNFYYKFFSDLELTPQRKEIFYRNIDRLSARYYKDFSRRAELSAEDLIFLNARKSELYFDFCLNKNFKNIHCLNDNDLLAAFKWLFANRIDLSRDEVFLFYSRENWELREELVKNYVFLWDDFESDLLENLSEITIVNYCPFWDKLYKYFQKIDYPQFFYSDLISRKDLPKNYFESVLIYILENESKMIAQEKTMVLIPTIEHKYFEERHALEILKHDVPVEVLLHLIGSEKLSKDLKVKIMKKISERFPEFLTGETLKLNFSLEEQKALLKERFGIKILALASDTDPAILESLLENIDEIKYALAQNPSITQNIKNRLLEMDWSEEDLLKISNPELKKKSELVKEILIKNARKTKHLFEYVKDFSQEQQKILFYNAYSDYDKPWDLFRNQNFVNSELLILFKKELFNTLEGKDPEWTSRIYTKVFYE